MDFRGKKVLIAGGSGFIGTNLAQRLTQHGARLRLTVHTKPLQTAIPDAEIVTADLRRPLAWYRTNKVVWYRLSEVTESLDAHASRRALRALLSMRFLCFNKLELYP